MAAKNQNRPYVLGLDLGVQSAGWVLIDLDAQGLPCGVRAAGVRCFESATGSEREIEIGKDESANKQRREARQHRRQLWRRARRQAHLFHRLQHAGLLPPGPASQPEDRDRLLKDLDVTLTAENGPTDHRSKQLLPYRLRAMALDQPLPPYALGRAIYHLAQRRGFLSNKKAVKEEKEEGKVKEGIAELERFIREAEARTVGEYFAALDPEQSQSRIRGRWTSRAMFLDEFEQIWSAQAPHHAVLTPELKQQVHRAIFFQRPLKSQKGLVGRCEFEPGRRRAPAACLEAQRFRYWQKINDLDYTDPFGEMFDLAPPRPEEVSAERLAQSADERRRLAAAFEEHAELSFAGIRRALGLKKPKGADRDYEFNLQRGGEKKLVGNRTAAAMRKVLAQRWDDMPEADRERLVDEILSFEHEDALARRLEKAWSFDNATASQLAAVSLERGYAALSRQAMRKLLPLLQSGIRYATAVKQVYGGRSDQARVFDLLPPVSEAVPHLRNPVVARALTELRRVLNAIIRRHGKPAAVRIELARDMKRSRKQREARWKEMRENEKWREAAARKILEEMGNPDPRPGDILKVLLANECNWECPYTGKPEGRSIPMQALLGPAPQFDVEHIIPFSRSLDNSFANKTLCYHEENRNVKRNRTPFEAYGGTPERWREILARVRRFRGPAARSKLRKFLQEKVEPDFAARQLVDTRYISRLAAEYVGLLYGGQIEASPDADRPGTRRVQVSTGGVTKFLRDEWKLNSILGDGGEKTRDDHRHHAVDAVAVALSTPRTIQMLARSAEQAKTLGRRLLAGVEPPWHGFLDDVRRAIQAINVSYRVSRRVRGPLHKETLYSKPHTAPDKKTGKPVEYRHVRKPLALMSAHEVENIVDDRIRRLVQEKIAQLGGGDPKKLFADANNHPYTRARDGRVIPIHKARVRKTDSTIQIGSGQSARHAAAGANHHMEIVAILDNQGCEKRWEGHVVSLFEATRRLRDSLPVVQRDHGRGKQFKFSLAGGEYVMMEHEEGKPQLYRVVVISQEKTGRNRIEFRLHTDARPTTLMKKLRGARVTKSPRTLMDAKARKVAVDPLGNVLPAND